MRKTRVAVADSSRDVRSGLRRLIESQSALEFAGEATSFGSAVRSLLEGRPGILLLGVDKADRDFFKSLSEFKLHHPKTRIVVLSVHDEPAYARQALGHGASGYLLKETADSHLAEAIEAVTEGRRYLAPSLKSKVYREEDIMLR